MHRRSSCMTGPSRDLSDRHHLTVAPPERAVGRSLHRLLARWPRRDCCSARAGARRAAISSTSRRAMSQPMPIAIPNFVGGTRERRAARRDVAGVIAADLKRSGLFRPLDPAAFIEKIAQRRRSRRASATGASSTRRRWSPAASRASRTAGCDAEFRLWDVFAGQQMAGQQFFTEPDNWRRVAHIIADAIYERLTGEEGYFDTRIVYRRRDRAEGQARQAPRDHGPGRRQSRYLTDGRRSRADAALLADGAGDHLHVLSGTTEPRVYLLNIETGQREAGRQFPRHDLRAALLAGRPAASS